MREPGGARQQLTFFAEPVRNAAPRPDQEAPGFLFPRDVGGSENYQIFYFDLENGEIRLLTDGTSRNGAPTWSRDGSQFAFFSTGRNGRDWDIHIAKPNGEKRIVLEAGGAWIPADFSPDGKRLVVVRLGLRAGKSSPPPRYRIRSPRTAPGSADDRRFRSIPLLERRALALLHLESRG